MAFLDNSGDIILDAVLTDTGRKRLARGDGSFRIVKFALGDDEINYETFNGAAAAGEEDLQIMQTPVLEAFTNNTSQMHSYLQTYTNNQTLLYLPTMAINNTRPENAYSETLNTFIVATNSDTLCAYGTGNAGNDLATSGVLRGYNPNNAICWIRIDQGIDNDEVPPSTRLLGEFYENQYMIEMDSRFGQIIDSQGNTLASESFIDDDQIASYYLSMNVNTNFVKDNPVKDAAAAGSGQVINGARGSILQFQIQVSPNLQNSDSFFTRLGGIFDGGTSTDFYFIDSIIRVTGLTTGYRLDVPVRYIRNVGAFTPCS